MKKKLLLFIGIVLSLCFIMNVETVEAASAKISISANKKSVTIGNSVSVTYRISSSTAIGAWNYQITTPSNFSFHSCNNGLLTHQVGQVMNNSTKSTSVTCTFKAKSTGSGKFTVKNYQVEDFNVNTMATTVGSTSVSVTKASSSNSSNNNDDNKNYSSNNFLKALSIEGFSISPTFNKNTTTYSVELPTDTKTIKVNATKEDSKASISGTGMINVIEGTNKVEIKVTAENGNVKTYTINANVKEKDPIVVKVDNKDLTIVRKKESLKAPNTSYQETTLSINNEEIPALYSDITKYTLVGLKDDEGIINLYIYNEKDQSYTLYRELTFKSIILYAIDDKSKIPEGYNESEITLDNHKIQAYKSTENSSFYLIYGMNIETGETNLYQYDSEEGTLQRFIETREETNEQNYLYVIIALGSILTITYTIILINLIRKTTKNKKTDKQN